MLPIGTDSNATEDGLAVTFTASAFECPLIMTSDDVASAIVTRVRRSMVPPSGSCVHRRRATRSPGSVRTIRC